MKKNRMLYSTKINDFGSTELGVYGVFDTEKVLWRYFVVSYLKSAYGSKLTGEICNSYSDLDSTSAIRSGKEFKTKEEGIVFIEDFKIKWETGSNTTLVEKRDQKLKDLLNLDESI
jgi:hypothetical protein